ncbi:MAG: TPM domain-containing protein [Treponema sp.]
MVVKKNLYSFVLFFLIVSSFYAEVYSETEKKFLIDEAGVLQKEDFSKIEALLKGISEKASSDVVIVLVSDTGDRSPKDYADDYFDYNNYGQGEKKEGSLLLIVTGDGKQGGRYAHISTHGKKTIKTIDDETIEKLLDSLIDGGLKENDYFNGIKSYLNALSRRFYNSLSLFEIVISLIIAILVFLFKFFGTKRVYKNEGAFASKPFYDVKQNSVVSFANVTDAFISSNTTSHVIERKHNSSSRGSTTHTSSSGEVHGGGGRSF